MAFRKLATDVYVSGQLSVDDIQLAAEQGVRTVICNRPDGETPDQPAIESLQDVAMKAGVEFVHIPVISGQFDEASVESFADVLSTAKTPILAYCRSGMRSSCLWALASAATLDSDAILAAAANAGYDLAPLEAEIRRRGARSGATGQ